jgi:tyrosyl-tRNA synthetase
MVSGTDFILKHTKSDAGFITLPLLTSADGSKIGKSSKNGIWLSSKYTCIFDFYQVYLLSYVYLYIFSILFH